MTRRTTRTRAYAPDPGAPGRHCDLPGCGSPGEYRAPKSRDTLTEYWWFCLEHVRGYNASWDFYKGMSPGQIEAQLRADTSWQRPTWPLGRLGGGNPDALLDEAMARDPLQMLHGKTKRPTKRPQDEAPAEMREPLTTLGLAWPLTMQTLKLRYKALAKQHHPDANGGDRAAEERLKTINLAYATLRSRLLADAPLAAAG
jgi:hypothetical protein